MITIYTCILALGENNSEDDSERKVPFDKMAQGH